MSSDRINEWVKKDPKSWAKLADSKRKKLSFSEFLKEFKKGAKNNGKEKAVKAMTQAQIHEIYQASGKSIQSNEKIVFEKEKDYQTKTIRVKRGKNTYTRSVTSRWSKDTQLALRVASRKKPRTKEYNEIVNTLVKTTGRTRIAVVTKIRRTRNKKAKQK